MRTVIDQMGTKSVFMSGNYRGFPRSSASWMDKMAATTAIQYSSI